MPAALSLVVAVYDVRSWVRECLESVAHHAPDGTQVVVVDDGSTDGSAEVCDEMAAGRPGWTVVHQPNRGLGAARNAGLAAAEGEYVGFVDGDDLLLPGYPLMLELAQQQDLDLVTGMVERTDGSTSTPSTLHGRALLGLGDAADIRRDHGLVFDTTAWNKVYRRALLDRAGLRFPEGVLYEDLALTIAAIFHAGRIGVVHQPVYAWRSRLEGLSITQRRFEIDNLRDRFAAVAAVDAFLHEQQVPELRRAHDDKVLELDLPLYTAALPESDQAYRAAYQEFFDHLDRDLTDERRDGLPPTLRLYVRLAQARRMDDLEIAVLGRRGPRAWAQDGRSRWQKVRDDLVVCRLEWGLEHRPAARLQVLRGLAGRTLRLMSLR